MRGSRRRLRAIPTVVVGAFLAFVAVQFVGAANATAAGTTVTGQASCASDGSHTVVWSVSNTASATETATVTGFQPSGASVEGGAATIARGASAQFIESGIDATISGATVTIHAAADSDGGTTDHSGAITFVGGCPRPEHVAAAPTGADADCTSRPNPVITIPQDNGVTYKLDGKSTSAGSHLVTPGSHTVTAASSTFALDTPNSFTFDLRAAPRCTTTVVPVSPEIVVADCSSGNAATPGLTPATTPGITYTTSTRGPYSPGQTVVVTAAATSGNSFASPAASGWNYIDSSRERYDVTFPATPGCVTAFPVAPTFTDDVCSDFQPTGPTYTIPSTLGVDYVVDGTVKLPGRYAATDQSTLTVQARAQTGFVLSAAASFSHRFTATPSCVTRVVAHAPSFSSPTCASASQVLASTYAVPATPGVVYSVNGVATGAGTYADRGGSPITVVAAPRLGYLLVGTTTWSHDYRQQPTCPVSVVVTAVRFANATCTSTNPAGGSYRVPRATGVEYRVDGVIVAPGRHEVDDRRTVTVVAHARAGYVLSGPASFTHRFGARSNCHGTDPDHRHRGTPDSSGSAPLSSRASSNSSPGLATTGSPIQELLLTGLVLLLLGAAGQLGAAVRRRGPAQLFVPRQ